MCVIFIAPDHFNIRTENDFRYKLMNEKQPKKIAFFFLLLFFGVNVRQQSFNENRKKRFLNDNLQLVSCNPFTFCQF